MADISKLHTPTTPPKRLMGGTGLRRTGGGDRESILEEFLPALKSWEQQAQVYHQIASNSPVVGASMHAIRSLMRRAPFIVEATGETPRHRKATDLVQRALTPLLVRNLVDDATAMMTYGYSVSEVKMDKDKKTGMWIPVKFAPRTPRSLLGWVWDEEMDEPSAIRQRLWHNGQEAVIPLNRCMHFRVSRGDADNPQGVSLLRHAYSSEYYARRLQEIEAIGTERDLTGLPVIKVPGEMLDPSATDEQKAALQTFQNMLQDIRRDKSEGLILPSDRDDKGNLYFEADLMSVAGNRQIQVGATIERHEKRIAQSFLAEFLFLGVSGGAAGSYALADSKTNLFALSLRALLEVISGQMQERVVDGMMAKSNGIPEEFMPDVRFGAIEPPDSEQLATFVERLTRSGFDLSDPKTEEVLREGASLPPAPTKEDKLKNAKERKEIAEAGALDVATPDGGKPQAGTQHSARGTGKPSELNETARTAAARQSDAAESKPPTPARAKSVEFDAFLKGLEGV